MSEKIGIISDTHDNLPKVQIATNVFNDNNVSLVIHCGDFVEPFTLSAFKDLKCSLIGVFGNCDGEIDYFLTQAKKFDFSIFHPPHKIKINDKQIEISHKPINPDTDTDILLFGHTHKPDIKNDDILIINPGEASGWLFNNPTIVILDLSNLKTEIVYI
jgi:putative phosphoesterase